MKDEPITLDEWLEMERKRIEQFASFYRREAGSEPENWPLSQGAGEWDEQYLMWDGSE